MKKNGVGFSAKNEYKLLKKLKIKSKCCNDTKLLNQKKMKKYILGLIATVVMVGMSFGQNENIGKQMISDLNLSLTVIQDNYETKFSKIDDETIEKNIKEIIKISNSSELSFDQKVNLSNLLGFSNVKDYEVFQKLYISRADSLKKWVIENNISKEELNKLMNSNNIKNDTSKYLRKDCYDDVLSNAIICILASPLCGPFGPGCGVACLAYELNGFRICNRQYPK